MSTNGHHAEEDGRDAADAPAARGIGDEVRAALATTAVFGELSTEAAASLSRCCAVDGYDAGETVFTMGQSDDALLLVLRGEARMTRADGERGDITVETVRPGDWVGLVPFALGEQAMGSAALQATDDLTVLTFDAQALRVLAEDGPAIALCLLKACAMAARGRKKTMDPGARVYRHLLGLVRKSAGGAVIPEMPRHAALAAAAGVSDVEAAGAVADLISRGIAKRSYPGLTILDASGLHRAAFD